MTKKSAKDKRQERRAKTKVKKQKQMALGGLIAFLLIGVLGFFTLQAANINAPEQSLERLELDPILGDPDAPVAIIEYAAYGCSACKAYHERGILDAILERYEGRVKLIYRDIPIIMPAYDQNMAEVAQCALDQGNEQFWLVHDWLYTRAIQGRTSQNEVIEAAGTLGLNTAALQTCVDANTHSQTVTYDLERGRSLGINSTPTFLVNDRRVFDPRAMQDMIESELARIGG